jgi:hypothetical protein
MEKLGGIPATVYGPNGRKISASKLRRLAEAEDGKKLVVDAALGSKDMDRIPETRSIMRFWRNLLAKRTHRPKSAEPFVYATNDVESFVTHHVGTGKGTREEALMFWASTVLSDETPGFVIDKLKSQGVPLETAREVVRRLIAARTTEQSGSVSIASGELPDWPT